MIRRLSILLLTLLALLPVGRAKERERLGVGSQVLFEENLGQWEARVRYRAQLQNGTIFVEDDCLTVVVRSGNRHPAPATAAPRYHAYRMHFVGGEATPQAEAVQPGYSNYFLGRDQGRWRSGVRSYAVVRYHDLWPGIDMELYSASGALKYNFIVHPGANPQQVALLYEGTDGVSINGKGDLIVKTSVHDIVELKPYVYQEPSTEVKSRWQVEHTKEGYRASVNIGSYDPQRDLVIDPILIFSTYTGSTADNWGTTAAYDSQKNTYTAGLVFADGYPVSLGAYDITFNGGAVDIGIFKFDTSGSQRLFATYLGGNSVDMPHSMFVGPMDELFIFGTTGSDNFPVSAGAYQTQHAGGSSIGYESNDISFAYGSDIFISRLSTDGSQLMASTLVGGSGNDGLNYRQHFNNSLRTVMNGNDSLYYNYGDGARGEIITDDMGNVYIGSTTMSIDFPTTAGCLRPASSGGQEGVVFKLDYNLRNLVWSTYLGGTGDDAVYSIDVDSAYNIVVCGGTNSIDFPTTAGTWQTAYGGGSADGFVGRISSNGHHLLAASYVGSALYDQLYFVRSGSGDDIFLFGQTKAPGATMIHNAGYSIPGSGMLLMRFAPDLATLRWSTVFGTPGRINLSPTAFTADICNRVYAAGWGRDFVGYNGVQWYTAGTTGMETSADAIQDSTDGQDFYILSLSADASQLQYATFFGELRQPSSANGKDHVDGGTSRFDRFGTLYQSVCGSCGGSQHFPTTAGAWSDTNRSSNCNNAVFRINVGNDFPVAEFDPPPAGCAPYTIQFHNTSRGVLFLWDFGDGTQSAQQSPQHTYTTPGTYTISLIASLPDGCSSTDTMVRTVQVLGPTGYSHSPLLSCSGELIQIGVSPALGASYQWTGSSPVSDVSVPNPWVSQNGIYILRTSAAGCTQTDTFYVVTRALVDEITYGNTLCHDSAGATITIVLDPSCDPDSITVVLGNNPSATPVQIATAPPTYRFTDLMPGRYTVLVTGYGCSYDQEITLLNPPPEPYTKQQSSALCNDSCTGWLHLEWNNSDTLMEDLCVGTYITHVTAANGCPIVDTTLIIRDHTLDSLHIWADADQIYLGESVQLHSSVNTETGEVTYLWAPAADLDRPTSPDPMATPTDTLACYTLTATSIRSGCTATDTLCLHCTEVVCGAPLFVIPNAFTPNGDGLNDAVCFTGIEEIVEFHIAIFNRWGERVYESDDPTRCWDGTYRGHPCLAGVYTYTCHIRCHAEQENDFKGDITLIR